MIDVEVSFRDENPNSGEQFCLTPGVRGEVFNDRPGSHFLTICQHGQDLVLHVRIDGPQPVLVKEVSVVERQRSNRPLRNDRKPLPATSQECAGGLKCRAKLGELPSELFPILHFEDLDGMRTPKWTTPLVPWIITKVRLVNHPQVWGVQMALARPVKPFDLKGLHLRTDDVTACLHDPEEVSFKTGFGKAFSNSER